MIHFSQAEIDGLIQEDLPLHDETTRAIGMPDVPGTLSYLARQPGVVAGVAPCAQMARSLGLGVHSLVPDGEPVAAGQAVLQVQGRSHALHVLWRQGMNLIEHLSGIASATAAMLREARALQPHVQLAATRKAFPGARRLQQYAVLCGGGMVHRAGLSESLLVFAQHRHFMPDTALADLVRQARRASPEKFLLVEVVNAADALAAVRAGADGVQIDKMAPAALTPLVAELRALRPGQHLTVNAAGGIRQDNVAAYAATGADVLVTSHLYTAAAADYTAVMAPLA